MDKIVLVKTKLYIQHIEKEIVESVLEMVCLALVKIEMFLYISLSVRASVYMKLKYKNFN